MKVPIKHTDGGTRDGVASLPEMEDLASELPYVKPTFDEIADKAIFEIPPASDAPAAGSMS